MKKWLIALTLVLFTTLAQAGGGGGKSPPKPPAPPPPPPAPQAPKEADVGNALAREKQRRLNSGGNASTLLTDGAPGNDNLDKPMLGGNTLLGK